MSKNTFKTFYRVLCKNLENKNLRLYKDYIQDEIERINKTNLKKNEIEEEKLYYENLMLSFIKMKKHIKAENDLLESYNINVKRDTKKEIENVAKRVGLRLTF
jgi:predicted nucleic acid-binding protein